jgi:nucleotide-binding universal stress UspA family protein
MDAEKYAIKILVPIDGSDSSLMAEETTVTIAKKTGASVTVFNVTQKLMLGYKLPQNIEEEIIGHIEQKADKIVSDALALFNEEGIAADVKTGRSEDPAESILGLSNDFDLIIMGAHGENEKEPYALGSITKKVIRHTTRPTLIAKKITKFSNLLVCIDGSVHSIKSLEYAMRLAENMNSRITLLNVQEPRIYDYAPKTARDLGEQILSKALDAAQGGQAQVDKKVEFGIPSDKIVQIAEKGNHDLIILGSRGLGTVKRFLLGSVSDDVSHKAKCSVVIVPAKT